MTASISKSMFWRGVLTGTPFLVLAVPFAVLWGVIATESGLSASLAMGFSVAMIAGAAQFAALQQILDGAPVVMVLAAALAVNLRMAMYSASLVPHLGAAPLWQRMLVALVNFDQAYAFSMLKYENEPALTMPERVGWFLGCAAPVALGWIAGSYAGAALGTRLPDSVPLDFALPIVFIATVAPMLRTRAHCVAAGVSVVAGLTFAGMPWGTGLLVAAGLGLVAGAVADTFSGKAA